jgi:hypothetical protein
MNSEIYQVNHKLSLIVYNKFNFEFEDDESLWGSEDVCIDLFKKALILFKIFKFKFRNELWKDYHQQIEEKRKNKLWKKENNKKRKKKKLTALQC